MISLDLSYLFIDKTTKQVEEPLATSSKQEKGIKSSLKILKI